MFDRLDEVSDKRVKALGKIERDKLRVASAYNKRVKEKLFSEIVFRRRFCLSGLEATNSESGRQVGKDRIESRK
jgi:tRNA U54 and U55 pseudouridine synthase Pus10